MISMMAVGQLVKRVDPRVLIGTGLGSWTWAHQTAWGLVPMGNPPSVISGAYCFLDLFGLAAAPRLIAAGSGLLDRRHRQPEPEQPLVVELGALLVAGPDDGPAAGTGKYPDRSGRGPCGTDPFTMRISA